MATSKGYLCDAEDCQAEMHNKRKALEHQKSGLSNDQLSLQDSKEHGHALSEASDDFPQKKPKLGPPEYQGHIGGDFAVEYVM
jgi:hypothetical protein